MGYFYDFCEYFSKKVDLKQSSRVYENLRYPFLAKRYKYVPNNLKTMEFSNEGLRPQFFLFPNMRVFNLNGKQNEFMGISQHFYLKMQYDKIPMVQELVQACLWLMFDKIINFTCQNCQIWTQLWVQYTFSTTYDFET